MSYWFKQRTYGFGASPANWKGWAAIAVFVAVGIAISAAFYWIRDGLDWITIAIWLAVWTVLDLVFIYVAWKKTQGGWRWRWSTDKQTEGKNSARN
jgi:hypothetical protein